MTYKILFGKGRPHLRPTIYGLTDPASPDVIRYVGMTTCPLQRYATHLLSQSQRAYSTPVAAWIRSLFLSDRTVNMVRLELVRRADRLRERELHWIRKLGAQGQADLNRTTNGEKPIVPESYFAEARIGVSA